MKPERIKVERERRAGNGPQGRFYLDDSASRLEALLPEFEGRIQLIYMDPPYLTGDKFYMRVRVGENGWRTGKTGLTVEAYSDTMDRESYLENMRRVLGLCHRLLADTGMIFAHIDYRVHPHMRLLLDELFGEDNFLNEIIWAYQSGGRSVRHFSRKHDVILFYRKGPSYRFDINAVKAVPSVPRNNHMRRHVDSDGRTYRSIKTGGKVYTYYDDEPVAPSDVWNDLSHLQQKDPERTGYDTQKPLALLTRIVKCASVEGDWVLDPFAGSSTTLEAASLCGRNGIGIDCQRLAVNIFRRRLRSADCLIELGPEGDASAEPDCEASVQTGIGFYHVYLDRFELPEKALAACAPLDAVDNWSAGYLRGGVYEVMVEFARGRKHPALQTELRVPMYADPLVICVGDVMGHSWYYALDPGAAP